MDKPVLTVLVGLPASGKSYFSEELSKQTGAEVFSSDELRKEMYGDVNDQKHNAKVFHELHKRIKECLRSGKDAVYDATNIKSKTRRGFLRELGNIDCYKKCAIMATPYEQCLENNRNRERKVPEFVIEKMYRSWNTPFWFEGWDFIELKYWADSKRSIDAFYLVTSLLGFDQDNPHHSLTLGEHMLKAYNLAREGNDLDVSYAALLHDIGKERCKMYADYKDRECEYAHFYSHENVGAYDVLFFDFYRHQDDDMILRVSALINLHMRPYAWEKNNNEKLKDKYEKLWGEILYHRVIMLHEADKAAH